MQYGLAPTMKAAMNLIGVAVGEPYPPYVPLSREDLAALAAYLKDTALAARVAAQVAA
jgi:dihydrodipicolinate synthase/N-acetylneuraminate lyase